jgi:hypothetical protein
MSLVLCKIMNDMATARNYLPQDSKYIDVKNSYVYLHNVV